MLLSSLRCHMAGAPFALGICSPGLKGMAGLQIACFRQLLKLRRSISPHVIFAELAEAPWQRAWWAQVLGFMHRLGSMDESIEGSLHPDISSNNIHGALGNPDAATGLLESRGSLQIWACRLRFQVAVSAMLITLLFARPC